MKQVSGDKLYIPPAFEEYSNSNILVMEFLDGVSINKSNILVNETQINREKIVNDIIQEMLAQIFDRGVFYDDPYPGHIFIFKNGLPAIVFRILINRCVATKNEGTKTIAGYSPF